MPHLAACRTVLGKPSTAGCLQGSAETACQTLLLAGQRCGTPPQLLLAGQCSRNSVCHVGYKAAFELHAVQHPPVQLRRLPPALYVLNGHDVAVAGPVT
jgi:hypothetical protein